MYFSKALLTQVFFEEPSAIISALGVFKQDQTSLFKKTSSPISANYVYYTLHLHTACRAIRMIYVIEMQFAVEVRSMISACKVLMQLSANGPLKSPGEARIVVFLPEISRVDPHSPLRRHVCTMYSISRYTKVIFWVSSPLMTS